MADRFIGLFRRAGELFLYPLENHKENRNDKYAEQYAGEHAT